MAEVAQAGASRSETLLEVYYDKAADRASGLLESRLEAAALFAANLIGGAWMQADRPALDTVEATAATPVDRRSTPGFEEGAFVGSRNSTIFHNPTCSHALRIKPRNLVLFHTLEEARAAARVPCKVCKPGSG
jgi:hypothetical protein